jgi:hypothetical protein
MPRRESVAEPCGRTTAWYRDPRPVSDREDKVNWLRATAIGAGSIGRCHVRILDCVTLAHATTP